MIGAGFCRSVTGCSELGDDILLGCIMLLCDNESRGV